MSPLPRREGSQGCCRLLNPGLKSPPARERGRGLMEAQRLYFPPSLKQEEGEAASRRAGGFFFALRGPFGLRGKRFCCMCERAAVPRRIQSCCDAGRGQEGGAGVPGHFPRVLGGGGKGISAHKGLL